MNYLELQQELQALSLDNSTDYAAWGTKNKLCVDWWYEQVFLYLADDEVGRKFMANATPVQYMASNQKITLPSDFFRIYKASLFNFTNDPGMDNTQEFFDYDIAFDRTLWTPAYIMQLQNTSYPTSLWIRYIPTITPLSADIDIPVSIPTLLQRNIADFALARYFRLHRDELNYKIALQNAQDLLQDRLNTYRTFQ